MRIAPLLAALAALILLSGCTSEAAPAKGVQGIVVKNAEELIGGVQPPSQQPNATQQAGAAQQGISCLFSVKQSSVLVGEAVDISLKSSFSGMGQFDLKCGTETRHILTENTLTLETSCRFSEPGIVRISVDANGAECASAIVEVRGKASGNCFVDSASVERDLSAYSYKWTTRFSGFSDGDVIEWVCDNTVGKKTIRKDPVWGMPLYETMSCDFPSMPRSDAILVSISGVACGQVSTR